MLPGRRTHTKSRTGCSNCKRRKVKCDESRPKCFNCQRHGVPCSLSAHPGNSEGSDSPEGTQQSHLPLTPSSRQPSSPPSPPTFSSTVAATGPNVSSDCISPLPYHELEVRNFELLHQFCTATADTVAIRKDMCHVWRVVAPREGYQHPFVRHGLLSFAAVHKAYLTNENRNMYLALADYHQTAGLQGFRPLLQDIKREHWGPLFCFASFTVLYTWSRPVRSEYWQLKEPIENFLEVLALLRGLKTTLSPLIPGVLRSELAPLAYGLFPSETAEEHESKPPLDNSALPVDMWDAITTLRAQQSEDLPSASLEHYHSALDHLEHCVKLIGYAGAQAETGSVAMWMYMIDESVVVDISARRAHATLMLAYFQLLMCAVERNFWYARGWARQLMNEIEPTLVAYPKLYELFQWPKGKIDDFYRCWG